MLSVSDALDRLHTALAAAKTAGADSADAVYVGDLSTGVQIRLGKLEDVGRSEGEEIGVRLFFGTRSASVRKEERRGGKAWVSTGRIRGSAECKKKNEKEKQ